MSNIDIDIWYGPHQPFGRRGHPQRAVNILGTCRGRVKRPWLTCRLNEGSPQPLSLGADEYRLVDQGDFNAEIPRDLLQAGANRIVLTAGSGDTLLAEREVRIDYDPGTVWPLPFDADLAEPDAPGRDVQIVDGQWTSTPHGLRTGRPGYDRLLAFGDVTWSEYRAGMTVIPHRFPSSDDILRGGVAMLVRWTGHPPDEHQPHREWRPSGMLGWYRGAWETWPPPHRHLCLAEGVVKDEAVVATPPMTLDPGRPYVFEMTVKSRPGSTSHYRYRVRAEEEPEGWLCDLSADGPTGEATAGSVLIIAYKADVTVSRVWAEPV